MLPSTYRVSYTRPTYLYVTLDLPCILHSTHIPLCYPRPAVYITLDPHALTLSYPHQHYMNTIQRAKLGHENYIFIL